MWNGGDRARSISASRVHYGRPKTLIPSLEFLPALLEERNPARVARELDYWPVYYK